MIMNYRNCGTVISTKITTFFEKVTVFTPNTLLTKDRKIVYLFSLNHTTLAKTNTLKHTCLNIRAFFYT